MFVGLEGQYVDGELNGPAQEFGIQVIVVLVCTGF